MTVNPDEVILPGMERVEFWGYRCERCEHPWVPRDKSTTPRVCPRCKSPYWNTPRKARVPS